MDRGQVKERVLYSRSSLKEIEAMSSFHSQCWLVRPGSQLQRTVDVFTMPCSIYLVHEDKKVVEKDLARIRELEFDGLWTVRA